ncbi:MAG: hypothetical protein ABSG78_22270 [Verrucomicrobiota bacterium]|jgi:hypothetical protein
MMKAMFTAKGTTQGPLSEQCDLHIFDGEFRLKPRPGPRIRTDVNALSLRFLTHHWSGKQIAESVSGYNGDGVSALCGIKEVIEASARYFRGIIKKPTRDGKKPVPT